MSFLDPKLKLLPKPYLIIKICRLRPQIILGSSFFTKLWTPLNILEIVLSHWSLFKAKVLKITKMRKYVLYIFGPLFGHLVLYLDFWSSFFENELLAVSWIEAEWNNVLLFKFPLILIGVLAPGSRNVGPSAQPLSTLAKMFWLTCLQNNFQN